MSLRHNEKTQWHKSATINSLNKHDLRCHAENILFTHVHRKAIRRSRKAESEKTKRRKRKDEQTKAKRRTDESENTKRRKRKDEKTLNSGLQGAN